MHQRKMKQLLLYAIENSDLKLIKNHILNSTQLPFDINFKAEDSFTPLHLAVSEGNEEMVRFFL
jgi:ankyrin repeat protein